MFRHCPLLERPRTTTRAIRHLSGRHALNFDRHSTDPRPRRGFGCWFSSHTRAKAVSILPENGQKTLKQRCTYARVHESRPRRPTTASLGFYWPRGCGRGSKLPGPRPICAAPALQRSRSQQGSCTRRALGAPWVRPKCWPACVCVRSFSLFGQQRRSAAWKQGREIHACVSRFSGRQPKINVKPLD